MNKLKITKELKAEAMQKKLQNIETIAGLDRSGLAYGEIERRVLVHTTTAGEKIYIQYPGKESAREARTRPWDFRPKLTKPSGEEFEDLSFKMIWDDLVSLEENGNEDIYHLLATVFYRMSVMVDNNYQNREYEYEDINITNGEIVNTGTVNLNWYILEPQTEYLHELENEIGTIRDISLEAYLIYNDLLAQNEDNKYFYRATVENGDTWNGNVGRRNNLWTHISIIQYLLKHITFTQIVDRFQRGQGVAPASEKQLEETTNGLIYK